MSSSTSTSENAAWRRLLVLYAVGTLGVGIMLGALLLALDPYDTGRFALFGSYGVPRFGQRLMVASLARPPEVDTAIIGNSTIQLIDPSRLSAASGRRIVSLAIPGTGPLEQLAVADWFLRHHRATAFRGMVLGIDDRWCQADGRLELTNPFPFWLYSRNPLEYAANLLRLKSFDAVARKLKIIMGRESPARPDGYNDYETGHAWDAAAVRQRLAQEASGESVATDEGEARDIAALPLLSRFLASLPEGTRTVLVFPPRYRDQRGAVGQAALLRAACRQAFIKLARSAPGASVVDFLGRDDIAGREENFWDLIHYRALVAREIEAAIATALREHD